MEHNKYEEARIIGSRALQLSQGAPLLIKLSEKDLEKIGYSCLEIAKREYKEDLIPIMVRKEETKKEEK